VIVLERVRWKNLCSTGNYFIEVPLNAHRTTLVTGENGHGKSTMIEALSYGLFDKSVRRVNKTELINDVLKEGLLVECEFRTPSHEYMVRRGQKPNVFEIYQDGTLLEQQSHKKYDQKMLEEQVLHASFAGFLHSTVLSKTRYAPFMMLPPRDRKPIVEHLLGISMFSSMNGLLTEELKLHRDALSRSDSETRDAATRLEMTDKNIRNLRDKDTSLILDIEMSMRQHKDEIAGMAQKAESLASEIEAKRSGVDIAALRAEKTRIDNCLVERSMEAATIERKIDYLMKHEQCTECTQDIDPVFREKKLAQLRDSSWAVAAVRLAVETERDAMEKHIAAAEKTLREAAEMESTIMMLGASAREKNGYVADLEKQISLLGRRSEVLVVAEQERAEMAARKDKLQEEKNELLRRGEMLEAARHLLSDEGIKSIIVSQYIPRLNQMIAKYLTHLGFFGEFTFDENFNETIMFRYCENRSYDSLSEGERARVDLALLFAMRAIARERHSINVNVLFFDEVLDSSLDKMGAESLIKLIGQELPNEESAFIISHRGDQLVDKFEHSIAFEKQGLFTKIVNSN
jgi:DNA repair exonuclease SbcCD ATPase subunit